MRVINVVVIKNSLIDNVESFGVFEEQLSNDVSQLAEKEFEKQVLLLSEYHTIEEFEDSYGTMEGCLDDGYYSRGCDSVCLTWTNI